MSTATEIIKQYQDQGYSQKDLKVLHLDPYLVGSEGDHRDAKWAASHWDTMMSERRQALHLRGFHYWLLSKRVVKPNGQTYAEPDAAKDWTWLLHAAQVARYLNTGEWEKLVDLKHPTPNDYDRYTDSIGLVEGADISVQDEIKQAMTEMTDDITRRIMRMLPEYESDGYQTYHLEVWCEKNSMGFIIDPICRKLGATYQPLVGQASVEKVNLACERARRAAYAGKKIRIWYIADWDRYGWSMVTAVARKLEFFIMDNDLEVDCKVMRLALNDDQIKKYKLPKAPKLGEAVVELDALEAIHQGELGKIIKHAMTPYLDTSRPSLVKAENERMRRDFMEILESRLKPKMQEIIDNIDLGDIGEDIVIDEVVDHEFTPPERGHEVNEDGNGWVYDSNRAWLDQIERYKEYKGERVEESA